MEVHIQPITCPITNIVIWEPNIEENAKQFSRYLSDYEELQVLGKGSYGVVARCRNLLDNEVYAAKKITLGVRSLNFEKVQREIEIVSGLKHRNVVQYYTSWTDLTFAGGKRQLEAGEAFSMDDDGSNSSLEEGPGNTNKDKEKQQHPCLYIVQECCERNLSEELLKREGNMTWNEASVVFMHITRGLLYIHANGIVHGDLNLTNILVKDNEWKIGDFGIARKLVGNCFGDEEIEELKGRIYDAPEDKVDFKRDLFSLGMILVELIAQPGTVAEKFAIFKGFKEEGKLPEKVSGHPLKSLALWIRSLVRTHMDITVLLMYSATPHIHSLVNSTLK